MAIILKNAAACLRLCSIVHLCGFSYSALTGEYDHFTGMKEKRAWEQTWLVSS